MEDLEKVWWNLANEIRGISEITPKKLLEIAKQKNIPLPIEIVEKYLDRRFGIGYTPEHICNFIISILKSEKPNRILDPFVGFGSLFTRILKALPKIEASGFNRIFDSHELVSYFTREFNTDLQIGNPFLMIDNFNKKFDCIVSHPPFGIKDKNFSIKLDKENIEIRDDFEKLVILKACDLLKENGLGIFIVSSNFFFVRKDNKVNMNLEKFNLFIETAISLPSGSFSPFFGGGGYLITLRKSRKYNDLFVGELSEDKSINELLIKNIAERKTGATPQLGFLTNFNDFFSFNTLASEYEIKSIVEKFKLEPTSLGEICKSINLENKKLKKGFHELPDSVYLPLIGEKEAVNSLKQLEMKPQNYVQIVLDPEKASVNQVLLFLNSKIGLKVRNSMMSGTIIKRINKTNLLRTNVYLFDKKTSNKSVSSLEIIQNLSSQLDRYKKLILNNPKSYSKVNQEIKNLSVAKDFDLWLETLPFPLASILRRYQAARNTEHKVQHLLRFFEAFTQFNVTLLLSSIIKDESFFRSEFNDLIKEEIKNKKWLNKPSFGNWRILYSKIAKRIRQIMNEEDVWPKLEKLLGTPDSDFIDMITSKNIQTEIANVNRYRNDWVGHGGYANEEEHRKRLNKIEVNLRNLRRIIANSFVTLKLLLPISSKFREGLHIYTAKDITGTKTPFLEIEIETQSLMEDKKLYLIHEDQKLALKLLPFVKIMPSPSTDLNACYYYNRLEKEKARFVSYHFEKDADVKLFDEELIQVFDFLKSLEDFK